MQRWAASIWDGRRWSTSGSRRWRRCATTASRRAAVRTGRGGDPAGLAGLAGRGIDADLGVSGRSVEGRDGLKGLVARVCLGEIGAIFGLEVSRLARSSADLSRLLECARLSDTLVIDSDGIYDLAEFNDRLLLGLKGTMTRTPPRGGDRCLVRFGRRRTRQCTCRVDKWIVQDRAHQAAQALAERPPRRGGNGRIPGLVQLQVPLRVLRRHGHRRNSKRSTTR